MAWRTRPRFDLRTAVGKQPSQPQHPATTVAQASQEQGAAIHPGACCSCEQAHGVNARVSRPAVTPDREPPQQNNASAPRNNASKRTPQPSMRTSTGDGSGASLQQQRDRWQGDPHPAHHPNFHPTCNTQIFPQPATWPLPAAQLQRC